MIERNSARRARFALLLLPAFLLASRPGEAATRVRKPVAVFPRETVEALSPDQRTTPLSLSEFRGLSKSEAEIVFGAAQAAVYVEKGGIAYALTTSSAPRAVRNWVARGQSRAIADPWTKSRLLRTTTAEGFASTINSLLPDLVGGAYGAYVTKFPLTVELPADVAAAQPKGPSRQSALPASTATAGTVLSETFETDPFASRWGRVDLDGDPTIAWGWTACDAHTGTHSMDGARGGTTGSAIGCASFYPPNQFNLMGMTSTLDLTGASTQAWMEVFMNMNMENNVNFDFIGVLFRDPRHQQTLHGFKYSGNQLGAWWRFLFNLKEWTPKLDLTLYNDNLLYLAWASNATNQPGFGARLDDITITTDIAPVMTCDAAVNTAFGQAPLSVTLTGSATGTTGSQTYLWDPNDGSAQVAGQVLPHTYTVPGEYSPFVIVTDTLAGSVVTRCTASVHVSAARSVTGASPTNDVCSAAKNIPTNSFSESFSATTFTQDSNEPQPCGPGIGATAWYKFTAPSPGTAVISLCSSNYDTVLAVYTGACGSFTNRYCNDDSAACSTNPAASKLTSVQMTHGTTYFIQVGASGGFGSVPGTTAQIDFTFTPGTNGDANGVGGVNSADVLYLINFIFAGGPAPLGPVDVNGDGSVNSADVLYLINYIFAGGPPPVP
jgi:hypothetical protein